MLTLRGLAICQHDENRGMVGESRHAPLSLIQDPNSPEQTAIQVCGCGGEKADQCVLSFLGKRDNTKVA